MMGSFRYMPEAILLLGEHYVPLMQHRLNKLRLVQSLIFLFPIRDALFPFFSFGVGFLQEVSNLLFTEDDITRIRLDTLLF